MSTNFAVAVRAAISLIVVSWGVEHREAISELFTARSLFSPQRLVCTAGCASAGHDGDPESILPSQIIGRLNPPLFGCRFEHLVTAEWDIPLEHVNGARIVQRPASWHGA